MNRYPVLHATLSQIEEGENVGLQKLVADLLELRGRPLQHDGSALLVHVLRQAVSRGSPARFRRIVESECHGTRILGSPISKTRGTLDGLFRDAQAMT
jgi:hypothetical protein